MKFVIFLLLTAMVIACNTGPSGPGSSVDEAVTQKVLDHHLETFIKNDLEGVMADYIEESVLITPDKTFSGLAQIRENFVGAFLALPTKGTSINVVKSVVNKDVAYIVWKATTPTLEFKYATDTFIVQNGKIVRQTYAGDVVPLPSGQPVATRD